MADLGEHIGQVYCRGLLAAGYALDEHAARKDEDLFWQSLERVVRAEVVCGQYPTKAKF